MEDSRFSFVSTALALYVHTCTIYRRRAPPPALECPGECSAAAQVVPYNPIWHRSQCCGVKWGARVLRVRSVSREEVWARVWCGCEADILSKTHNSIQYLGTAVCLQSLRHSSKLCLGRFTSIAMMVPRPSHSFALQRVATV